MQPALMISKWGLPFILVCGLAGFFALGLHQLVTWEIVALHYTEIDDFLQQNQLSGYAVFVLFYAVVVALSLPIATLLTLAAGAIIGWPAFGLILVAATLGASLLFIAARGLFCDLLRTRTWPFFSKLESDFTQNAFSYLLFLRLVPVAPFWVINILPAFSRMKLIQFIGATAIGIIPGTFLYVAVGRSFEEILRAGETPNLTQLISPTIWLPLLGLAILALLPNLYRRFSSASRINRLKNIL